MRYLLFSLTVLLLVAGSAQAAPTIVAPPSIVGEAIVGRELSALDTLVDDASTADLTLSWERSTATGNYLAIEDAHDVTYTPTIADAGHRLRVHVGVETAEGSDAAWSEPTVSIRRAANDLHGPLRIGPERGAPLRLRQWIVTAGGSVDITGSPDLTLRDAQLTLVLEPTINSYDTVEATLTMADDGRVHGTIVPLVNAVVWLELRIGEEATQRLRIGVVGVRPRIDLRLAARPDGLDTRGRLLVRDLTLLRGSQIAPGIPGLRLTWQGILPGERTGTAVCRTGESIVSTARGAIAGSCSTRGAWSRARWRLVHDPGTSDPGAAPFLAAASAWIRPRLAGLPAASVPVLPRAYATLPAWISASSKT